MLILPIRKPNRLKDYDYGQNGAYFVTICTQNHENLFGRVVTPPSNAAVGAATCRPPLTGTHTSKSMTGPHVELSDIGRLADVSINNIPRIYPRVSVNKYVIMPNHVHAILTIKNVIPHGESGRQVAAPTTVHTIIGNMKRFVSMQTGRQIWQKSFHDHIIRHPRDYYRIEEYIANNPAKWAEDRFYRP